ncbi:TPA: hypothetical protein ROX98_001138 [Bacillus pseudomycoides]|nr:hypothetical protein [Bacillus pseudomycoides]
MHGANRGNGTSIHLVQSKLLHLLQPIEDKGEGISEQHLSHISKRFYRVDKSRTRATGGTGLSLAIVKEIVELHGGSISVTSELGHGTIFTIYLKKENMLLKN